MTHVLVETAPLDDGTPLMTGDYGPRVYMAYDPKQTTEAEALAVLCIRVPRLVGDMQLHRVAG